MSELRLSVVDQVPVHDGQTQSQALLDSVRLAQLAEKLGYHRYWLAEHHGTPSYACSAPEIAIGQIAAATNRIRVGSGGVMLSHYSPYKVAEVFKTLSAFHPGRIDLGVGRAPGGDVAASRALAFPRVPIGPEVFINQLHGLVQCINGEQGFEDLPVTPMNALKPQLWALGSSDGSIEMAARFSLGFVLALFIGTHERPVDIIKRFREQYRVFHPNEPVPAPAMLASAVICAETEEQARLIAASHTYWKVMVFRHGQREELRPPEQCLDLYRKLSPSDQAYFDETLGSMIVGTPQQCRSKLQQQADAYQVEETLVVAVTYHFKDRLNSYRLLMEG